MATTVLTLRVREETKAKLDKLTQATHRSKSFLAEEAIARFIDLGPGSLANWRNRAGNSGSRSRRFCIPIRSFGSVEEICRLNGCGAPCATLKKRRPILHVTILKPPLRWFRKRMNPPVFISQHPDMWRPGRVPGTRELMLPHFSCIIPYRVREQRVEILHVFHTARKWPQGSDVKQAPSL